MVPGSQFKIHHFFTCSVPGSSPTPSTLGTTTKQSWTLLLIINILFLNAINILLCMRCSAACKLASIPGRIKIRSAQRRFDSVKRSRIMTPENYIFDLWTHANAYCSFTGLPPYHLCGLRILMWPGIEARFCFFCNNIYRKKSMYTCT